jgi:hypothetical protein
MEVLSFQPCVPIVLHRRSCESVEDIGMNELVEWRPDSSMLVVAVSNVVFSKDWVGCYVIVVFRGYIIIIIIIIIIHSFIHSVDK